VCSLAQHGMCVFNTRVLRFKCACLFDRRDVSRCRPLHTCGLLSRSLMLCVRGGEAAAATCGFPVAFVSSREFPRVVRALPWLAAREVILNTKRSPQHLFGTPSLISLIFSYDNQSSFI